MKCPKCEIDLKPANFEVFVFDHEIEVDFICECGHEVILGFSADDFGEPTA